MTGNDYFKWAQEYLDDAERLEIAIKRYEAQLNRRDTPLNREHINSQICRLSILKSQMIGTANELTEKGNRILAAEKRKSGRIANDS
jgi:hypothetical protein